MFVTTGHLLQGFPTAAVDTPMSAYASGTFLQFQPVASQQGRDRGFRAALWLQGLGM